jgi:16S rRNA G966 N2-methylase RsmD
MKGFNKKQKSIDVKKKHLEHSDSNNNNNNNTSTKKVKDYSQNIPSTSSTDIHCDSCGKCYGEMISCDTCSARFHLLCIDPPLTKEDISKGSFFCENCRIITKTEENLIEKDKQQKLTLPFLFDPKKTLHINGCKKTQQYHSTLGQIKLPTGIKYIIFNK